MKVESAGAWRLKYSAKTVLQAFPTSAVKTEEHLPKTVLDKTYHWLDLGTTYPKKPDGYLENGVVACAVMACQVEYEEGSGGHRITFELVRREV
jgi:hypothetical protein